MTAFDIILRHFGHGDDDAERFSFELEPGQEVTFGRAPANDITIPDPERKVSSHHGKIRHDRTSGLMAFDLGSLNGTYLEGVPIDAAIGAAVATGAQLRVGEYELEVAPPAQVETIRTRDISSATSSLISSLEDAYDLGVNAEECVRQSSMQGAVEAIASPLNRQEISTVLESILGQTAGLPTAPMVGAPRFPAAPAPAASAPKPPPRDPAAAASAGNAPAESALRRLAEQLVPGKPLETAEDFETFTDLLRQVCSSTLNWLAMSLQSRGVFAQEFGAEATLVFQRSTNPLKAMSFEGLMDYLLDWRQETDAATRNYYLDGVLKDLTEHQVGVIAGVKEAVAGLITRLSPERIEALAEKARGWSKANKVWSTYQQVHKELAEEQSKLFNEMITPAIQKGYLHKLEGEQQSGSPPD